MESSYKKACLVVSSAILSIVIPSFQASAEMCYPQDLIAAYQKSTSPQAAAQKLTERLDHVIKPSKALREMMAGVSDGSLIKEVEKATHVRASYKIDPRTLRSAKMGRYFGHWNLWSSLRYRVWQRHFGSFPA